MNESAHGCKTDLQHGIDLNKTPGQAYHSIANKSRKLNGFAARLVKREPGISYIQGYTEVWDSVRVCWVAQLCPILCKPLDCSPPGFSVHGIFQARILECVAVSFSRGSSRLRDQIRISCVSRIAGGFFTCWANIGGSLGSNKFWCEWEVKELWKFLNTHQLMHLRKSWWFFESICMQNEGAANGNLCCSTKISLGSPTM